ncbi:Secreted RxLR effector peptide protein [Phytophthora cinnamomi]|uniref:Secreted RxLR effector peptide protein n=1 Tax=Phytophthora cinnamomi TaxID=4785 RepID=UPI003559C354|nr:Secreted RxLR effector peptide protein [Phytophthora cinnamomi]
MIEAAKKVKSKANTAKRVEVMQIQTWLGNKQTPGDVFKLLKLDNAVDDVLTSPALNTWSNHLNAFNKEIPDKKSTLIATLTAHYGDEGVARMLDAAKKVEATKTIATNLEAAQIQHWLNSRKMLDSVFKLLNLDTAGENLLANPLFTTFTKFTDAFHAKNLGSKMTTVWIVRAHYSDFDVAKMILAVEKTPISASSAKRMEGTLFKNWMASPNTPDDAFKTLKLDQVGIESCSRTRCSTTG